MWEICQNQAPRSEVFVDQPYNSVDMGKRDFVLEFQNLNVLRCPRDSSSLLRMLVNYADS